MAKDQPIALRLIRGCRLLHQRLCLDRAGHGFDGERCSDIEGLQASPPAPDQRRDLVILDDTLGTGSPFLRTFVALSPANRNLLQCHTQGAGTTEFLLGHHAFVDGAPNALARVLLPLFKRIEEVSVCPCEWPLNLPADLHEYDIDNPEAVALHYRRE
jgi:hypothetical protein